MKQGGVTGGGPTVLIVGEFGNANTGDEAILAVMLRDLRARRPDLQCVVVSGAPEQTAAMYGVQAIVAATATNGWPRTAPVKV